VTCGSIPARTTVHHTVGMANYGLKQTKAWTAAYIGCADASGARCGGACIHRLTQTWPLHLALFRHSRGGVSLLWDLQTTPATRAFTALAPLAVGGTIIAAACRVRPPVQRSAGAISRTTIAATFTTCDLPRPVPYYGLPTCASTGHAAVSNDVPATTYRPVPTHTLPHALV